MKGFRNAPHITEFAVGMRVTEGYYLRGIVIEAGNAGAYIRSGGSVVWRGTDKIPAIFLDLTSLWCGRECVEKATGLRANVTAPPEFTWDHYVHYEREDGVLFVRAVECFWDEFEPVEKG